MIIPKPQKPSLSPKIQKRNEAIKYVVSTFFKNKDGEPYMLTDGQCEMFYAITNPELKYVWISAPTRYGKSEIASIALLYLAKFHNLKISVVGATDEKANKIMEYVVSHISDHEKLSEGIIGDDIKKIEKLKIQSSKKSIRWKGGGWIYITSVDYRTLSAGGERAIGEGADVVYVEESPLIKTKEQFSKIVRMPEIDRGWGKLIQAGNLLEGNHFEEAYNSTLYYKVLISLPQAMYEKGWSVEFIKNRVEQMTTKDAKRMYFMEFPKKSETAFLRPQKYDSLPQNLRYFGAFDPAMGKKTSKSMSAIVILGVDENGFMYEVDSVIEKIKPSDAIDLILSFPYQFESFGVEAIQFQEFLYDELQKKMNFSSVFIPFEKIKQTAKKEQRIESLEPYFRSGVLKLKGDNELYKEAIDYPDSEFLDGLDVLEMCVRLVKNGNWEPFA